MSVLILYEIAGEPKSAYLNALEMVHADAKKELFLVDILHFIVTKQLNLRYNYAFYAVVRDRLVWLDSPTSLVPVCPDGIVRLVLKPTAHPPLIHVKQYTDFAEKSRMQFYSREDYERSNAFAMRTFHEARLRAGSVRVAKRDAPRSAPVNNATNAHFTATFPNTPAFDNSDFFAPSFPSTKSSASYSSGQGALPMEDPFAQKGSNTDKYVDTPELRSQYDEFADFDANFESDHNSKSYYVDDAPRKNPERGNSAPFRDRDRDERAERSGDRDRSSHEEDRRYATSKYNLDHRGKSSNSINSSNGGNDNNLNSIVGEETAAALTEAVEAAGVAAKSFLTFASTWGKSVIDSVASTTQAAAQSANANILHSGTPGKLHPGMVVQVGRMVVTVVRELAEGGFGIVYLVEDSNPQGARAQQYALKQLLCQSREQVSEAHAELDALRQFQGRSGHRIIELLEFTPAGGNTAAAGSAGGNANSGASASQPRQVLMLFPLYPQGTLWDKIADAANADKWPFPEPVALYMIMCAAESLQVLHKDGLAHRDVKPHNFLLETIPEKHRRGPFSLRPVLMDLGSVSKARLQVRNKREALELEEEAAGKTSAAYRAPELTSPPFPPFNVDERVDTWGLGCTMYCLAFGRSPFETPKEGVLRLAILNGKYSTPPGLRFKDCVYSAEYMQLVDKMLTVDSAERPYVEDVIRTCQQMLAKYNFEP